ncbi:ATP-binding protein [Pseudomonas sp. LP_7_YM]|uniref:ATP-binding protein n=1 Tax=Pseudomonas sp. LP_7_YM TaxID=2485137 RepID=UPI00105E83C5|nr:ATP-binding protein [Pseudomonas sp. LP_7_YM]TDV65737.1 histidine kinase/DNA gyrase B/HSP90-like ATPase [Pseudomonas sp. LP_7_YM]
MKRQVGKLDAVPSKRLFLSIIADYDLNKSICELVDNGFDVWTRSGRQNPIKIMVSLAEEQGIIRVEDDAGGLPYDELRYMVGPGQSGSSPTDETIGIFGVGTKRAVVALAEDITIRTRHGTGKAYQIEFGEDWLEDEEWELPLFQVDGIAPNTTQVELQKLRIKLTEEVVDKLRSHLQATYAKLLSREDVTLLLNSQVIEPRFFNDWSYPPDYEPRHYTGQLNTPNNRVITVDVTAGLSSESSPTAGEYGVYFYCNERLVAPAMKSFDVGFTQGQAGLPHPKIALTKVIVSLSGDASEMPWNSSKSDISTKHHTFIALHDWLVTVVADYARISRIWMGDWPEKVFAHKEIKIIDVVIDDFLTARRSFLPNPPKSRPRLAERVAIKNGRLVARKPWIKGLYEGVVAATTVAKQPLEQANWFAFNILELTLISALKTYLVNESNTENSESDLKALLHLTPKISDLLKQQIALPKELWLQIENISRRREDLMYGRATPTITESELEDANVLVQTVLKRLFRIDLEA